MTLPEQDIAYLGERELRYQLVPEANMVCLVFADWKLPVGYDRTESDLLVRIPTGYPDIPPDMWWFDPPLKTVDGRVIPATESFEDHLGRRWQRWSRHFQDGQWKSGIDSLESFLALINAELLRCAGKPD